MPHCLMEHSRDLGDDDVIESLLVAVHDAVARCGLFDEGNIKTRAMAFDHFTVARQRTPFVHVTVKLISGREVFQRRALAQAVLDTLKEQLDPECSLSVDIRELDRDSYLKG